MQGHHSDLVSLRSASGFALLYCHSDLFCLLIKKLNRILKVALLLIGFSQELARCAIVSFNGGWVTLWILGRVTRHAEIGKLYDAVFILDLISHSLSMCCCLLTAAYSTLKGD